MVFVLPNRSFGKCVAACHSSRSPQTHIWQTVMLTIVFHTQKKISVWFHPSWQNDNDGLMVLFNEVAWVFALPYAALFMFSFYPAIHHSSVSWFKLWTILTELVRWSELGQVWIYEIVCMCEYGCEFYVSVYYLCVLCFVVKSPLFLFSACLFPVQITYIFILAFIYLCLCLAFTYFIHSASISFMSVELSVLTSSLLTVFFLNISSSGAANPWWVADSAAW